MAVVRPAALFWVLMIGATMPATCAADGIEGPPAVVRARLSALYPCTQWSHPASAPRSDCLITSNDSLIQASDFVVGADGSVETVNVAVQFDTVSGRRTLADLREQARGRAFAATVVATVLPRWRQGPRWVREAIRSLKPDDRLRMIRVGQTTALVQYFAGIGARTGVPDSWVPPLAYVTVTRSSHLENWNFSLSRDRLLAQSRRR